MNLNKLEQILAEEPKYRLKQVYEDVFHNLIGSWQDASDLPLILRDKLDQEFSLKIDSQLISEGKTKKALITFPDNIKIESVLLSHGDGRQTVCVSSQAGCSMGCNFCATGQVGFKRNLTADEIIEQVLFFARFLKKENQRVSNIVFMGMGEPFLNYDNVLAAVNFLNRKDTFNIGARKISISTCGIIPGIKKLSADKRQLNLAISLHAPDDSLRDKLMPINKKYPVGNLIAAVNDYVNRTSRKVMFEYLLIDQINDSAEQAEELAKLMEHRLFMVNLIPYNSTGKYKPSNPEAIKKFKIILEQSEVNVTLRYGFGHNINAACGQLTAISR
ncbi:23S rRNA (adenine(2503)-C(2))-methyltransferase RlmN [Candidatus Parcubacteria bacterium]|nr:MAG: 23S rRNA (adenine(2503)-C(2))-methyltransferase RlmN [Candidatus Parcubacteria bacterium]